jgi:serine/threonine-protein kinase
MQPCPHCNGLHGTNVLFCPATGKAISVSRIQEGALVEGKYQIIRRIASGGMGAIYEVQHLRIGKRFAMKLLLPELAGREEVTARFEREAKAASAIGHPNIIEITDMGSTEDGLQFIVMELLHGEDLAALIVREAPLDADRTVHLVNQVLMALEAAHGAGIVHRDMKPENVFLIRSQAGDEVVKLLDFGISKIANSDENKLKLTSTGLILGTPYYMSPEQAKGARDIDHRSDLYSVGVLLYEALTGQRPYTAENLNSLIYQILAGQYKRPTELRPDLPPRLENVILKALASEPDQRFQTAAEFREALLGHLEVATPRRTSVLGRSGEHGHPDGLARTEADGELDPLLRTQPDARAPRRSGLIAALVMVVLALGGLGAYLALRGGKPAATGAPPPVATKAVDAAAPPPVMTTEPVAPAVVRITVDLRPAEATLTLDGKAVSGNPFTIPKDGQSHALAAEAKGFKPGKLSFTADEAQRLQLHLEPEDKVRKDPGGGSSRPTMTPPPPDMRPGETQPGRRRITITTDI